MNFTVRNGKGLRAIPVEKLWEGVWCVFKKMPQGGLRIVPKSLPDSLTGRFFCIALMGKNHCKVPQKIVKNRCGVV